MILREDYLKRIKPFLGKPVIKAVTGLRRVGKSVFVRQIIDSLIQNGVSEENIVYVDMESLDYDFIRDYNDLNAHVLECSKEKKGTVCVFVDEIQNIAGWERAVASWSGKADRFDIVITGSNSAMFSGELSTKLTGRYIEFPVYPLSLREFRSFYPQIGDVQRLFELYLRYGGLPGLHILDSLSDENVLPFLQSIHDTIVLKDIVRRKNIRNTSLLDAICRFAYDNISNPVTASSISAYLKNQKLNVNVQTVINYLNALVDAQLFYKVHRYDVKGKKILEINNKYYATDLGLRNSQVGYRSGDISYLIENLVFLELRRRYGTVYTGEVEKREIDFIAVKNTVPHYFQVTMSLSDSNVLEREERSLLSVEDNYPKTIITLERAFGDGMNGIRVISLLDFLLEE